jgi:hypothetical protein
MLLRFLASAHGVDLLAQKFELVVEGVLLFSESLVGRPHSASEMLELGEEELRDSLDAVEVLVGLLVGLEGAAEGLEVVVDVAQSLEGGCFFLGGPDGGCLVLSQKFGKFVEEGRLCGGEGEELGEVAGDRVELLAVDEEGLAPGCVQSGLPFSRDCFCI